MDFLDNVVKSSNALLKERLNNPFGSRQQSKQDSGERQTGSVEETPSTSSDNQSTSKQGAPQPPSESEPRGSQSEPNNESSSGDGSRLKAIAADAEAVTQNAVKGAKNIGTFLFSMANKAGQTVTQTAKQVKQTVENTSIFTDLTREQQEFIREHGGSLQAGVLPWDSCNDESKAISIKEQILSLSQDKRNFVRSPPSDASFRFDPQQHYPIALTLLKEDPNLGKMRFELVPKLVNEDTFWTNYFYRVSLLKQMSERGADSKLQGWASSRSSSGEGPDETANDDVSQLGEISPNPATATTAQNFDLDSNIVRSDELATSTNDTAISQLESDESRKLVAEAEDLKSKLRELNIGSLDLGDQDEDDKWEEELQKDLQEFELVSGVDVSALDEEALDREIMELKKSSQGG